MIVLNKSGIQLRLLLAAFFMISSVAFSLQLAGVQITKNFMQNRFSDRISFLAKYLALNAEVGVLINDREGLKSLALNLLGEEDVGRVTIMDNQNNMLVDIEREVLPPVSSIETPVLFKKAGDENLLFLEPRPSPFKSDVQEEKQVIGKVRIIYSTHGINVLMGEITVKFMLLSGVFALVGGAVFYFISRPMVTEIRRLANGAEKVGKGELAYRADIGTLPETRKLAMAFNNMLDSLAQNRAKLDEVNNRMARQQALAEVGKFSLMIAHEFKNPLGIIKSSFDMLKKDYHIPDNNQFAWYIEDEIRHVNSLVEDFLAFSRPSEAVFRKTDLNAILKDICIRFALMYENRPHVVFDMAKIPDVPFYAEADAVLITRCISNLLKNAWESVEDKGEIIVAATMRPDNCWRMTVSDSGSGVDENHKEQIFEPFYTTKIKGSGLGLAFVKHVVTAHVGEVAVKNRPGGGSVFSIIIPGTG